MLSVILLSQPVLHNSSYYKMLNVAAFVICICNSITIAILLYLYHILTKNKYWIYIKNIGYISKISKKSKISDIFDIFENIMIFSIPGTFLWKIETRLLCTPPLMSFPHTIDMYLSGGRGSHYVNKGGKYDIKGSISSTMITVCMFYSCNMMAHFVHWSLAWSDAYMYSRKKIMNL